MEVCGCIACSGPRWNTPHAAAAHWCGQNRRRAGPDIKAGEAPRISRRLRPRQPIPRSSSGYFTVGSHAASRSDMAWMSVFSDISVTVWM